MTQKKQPENIKHIKQLSKCIYELEEYEILIHYRILTKEKMLLSKDKNFKNQYNRYLYIKDIINEFINLIPEAKCELEKNNNWIEALWLLKKNINLI